MKHIKSLGINLILAFIAVVVASFAIKILGFVWATLLLFVLMSWGELRKLAVLAARKAAKEVVSAAEADGQAVPEKKSWNPKEFAFAASRKFARKVVSAAQASDSPIQDNT